MSAEFDTIITDVYDSSSLVSLVYSDNTIMMVYGELVVGMSLGCAEKRGFGPIHVLDSQILLANYASASSFVSDMVMNNVKPSVYHTKCKL